jgi:hypothetical protein
MQFLNGYVLLGLVLVSVWGGAQSAFAQPSPNATNLASKASVIVRGTIVKTNASDEPLVPASSRTVVIRIREMYAGSEFVGDLKGQTATVILSEQSRAQNGGEMLFFGDPRFAGKVLTIADIGEMPISPDAAATQSTQLMSGIQNRRDAPIRARLNIASAVFSGRVEKVTPVEMSPSPSLGREQPLGEHDPEFHVAWVRVAKAVSGVKVGALVAVVFPASRDIVWFNVRKPKPGEDVLVIGHRPQPEEVALLRAAGLLPVIERLQAVLATDAFDLLSATEEGRVAALFRSKEAPR